MNLYLAACDVTSVFSTVQLGEQSEDFKVEPDQRYEQSECAVPLHVFGGSAFGALLDEVEIQHQVQSRDHDDEQAEADADAAAEAAGKKKRRKTGGIRKGLMSFGDDDEESGEE